MNGHTREPGPGTVVVVTGASSGIGRAVAAAFAARGARLVLAARSADVLAQVAGRCAGAHPRAEAVAVTADVTDFAATERVARTAVDRFGRIDIWVNAAGVGLLGRLDRVPPADVRRLWETNVLGAFHGARAALPVMRRQGGGILIDVSSVLGGAVVAPYMGAYAASKAALVTLDEVLRQELRLSGDTGVAVCTILPGGVDTPFFRHAANHTGRRVRSLPAVATPQRVARAVVRAAARPRRRVHVGPGSRLLPWAHALAPGAVRSLVRRRTGRVYLDAPGTAPITRGVLYEPSAATASVAGGRHAGVRTAVRRVAGCTAALASAAAVRSVARHLPSRGLPSPHHRRS
ncbi:SDR family NAD(P)-dependent oxidoreductase [Streptomyces sp. TLI_105]|uniref:SDR family NAD(P)-dependent oxidoreductase n=1 Tax=Streptomyces sp. TLI_105 TaxID=1881019 RepID=UPI0015A539B4|nr:SDR family NAD(P)-dependent oxidoreductase [Streptomyces sp. TLI_105]